MISCDYLRIVFCIVLVGVDLVAYDSGEEVGVAIDHHLHERLALQELDVRCTPDPTVHVPKIYNKAYKLAIYSLFYLLIFDMEIDIQAVK